MRQRRFRGLTQSLAIMSLAILSGCATAGPDRSWVADIPGRDAEAIAEMVAALVTDKTAPADKTIYLVPASLLRNETHLSETLKARLRARGYSVATDDGEAKDRRRLQYLVTDHSGGYLLRVKVNGQEASTVLSKSPDGQLAANAPLAVREVVQ